MISHENIDTNRKIKMRPSTISRVQLCQINKEAETVYRFVFTAWWHSKLSPSAKNVPKKESEFINSGALSFTS